MGLDSLTDGNHGSEQEERLFPSDCLDRNVPRKPRPAWPVLTGWAGSFTE